MSNFWAISPPSHCLGFGWPSRTFSPRHYNHTAGNISSAEKTPLQR
jgi:hypothetical protein